MDLLRTAETLNRIGMWPGQKVLEIGPGDGRLLIPAAERVQPGGKVVGLDVSEFAVRWLESRAMRQGIPNLRIVHGNAVDQHFSPEMFDVIYMVTALGEISDRAAALRQCWKALKPGGWLSITEMKPDPHYLSREKVQQLAEEAGFRLEKLTGGWWFFTANFGK